MTEPIDRVVNGIAFTDYGDQGFERAPVLVLLHSLALSRATLADACLALSDGYRCLAVDVPGHGDSPRADHFLTMEDMADAVATMLQGQEIDRVVVVGNSMGATIAVAMARRHPDLVEQVVLVGAAVFETEADRRGWLHSRSAMFFDSDGTVKLSGPEFVVQLFGQYDEHRYHIIRTAQEAAAPSLESAIWAIYCHDTAADLSRVTQPVLAVFGSNDPYHGISGPVIRKHTARLDEVVVDGGSHILPMDKPTELAASVRDWLGGDRNR